MFFAALDSQAAQGLGVLAALLGGALVKKLSKSKKKVVHEWGAPVAAAAVGIGFEAITGQTLDLETVTAGTGAGGMAVLLHSIYYGLFRSKKEIR